MVERGGRIGQFRALNEAAWHILEPSVRYIGIEHIAKHNDDLTDDQVKASTNLLLALRSELGFTFKSLKGPNLDGIGVHQQFMSTGCGDGVFWNKGSGHFGPRFWDILQLRSPIGQWKVIVGDWTWIYIFDQAGSVQWQKLRVKNPITDTGTGAWSLWDDLKIVWKNGSRETWNLPLTFTTTGRLTQQGEDDRQLAERERWISAIRMN